jgi:hypothetical protein
LRETNCAGELGGAAEVGRRWRSEVEFRATWGRMGGLRHGG